MVGWAWGTDFCMGTSRDILVGYDDLVINHSCNMILILLLSVNGQYYFWEYHFDSWNSGVCLVRSFV